MADGHFPQLVSATRDANSSSNPIFTRLTDGTDLIAINADGSLNVVATATNLDIRDLTHVSDSVKIGDGTDFLAVNADGSINVTVTGGASNTQYAEDAAHVSGDIGTMALAVRKDSIASNVSADGDYASLLVDANGRLYTQIHDGGNSITVDGSVTVSATDLDIRDLTHVSDSVKVGDGTDLLAVNADGSINAVVTATDLDIRNLSSATDSVAVTDGGGSLTVDGAVTVSATDLDIRDLTLAADAVRVSANTSANSQTNPIFVQNVENAITGEVHDYNTASAVAADTASNHDYTVTTNLKLKQVTVAASGGCKIEVQVGPVASLVSKKVAFIPKEGGVVELHFNPPIEVPNTSTGTVRVIRTNRQGQAQDLYSTIEGIDN